jgi:hypothetical protein
MRLASVSFGIDIEFRKPENRPHGHSNTEQNGQPNSHRSKRVTYSWINKENSAMNYNPSIPNKKNCIVSIGTISVVCEHCLVLKFKDESKDVTRKSKIRKNSSST